MEKHNALLQFHCNTGYGNKPQCYDVQSCFLYTCTGKKHTILTRSKTGSLQPRTFNMDDLKRRSTAILSKSELDKLQGDKKDKEVDKDGIDSTRITRLKAQQIATGIIIVSSPAQMNLVFLLIFFVIIKRRL